MKSQLNLQINALAFADNTPSNNPMIRQFDLTYKLLGIPAGNPDQKPYTIEPGNSQTIYDGTRVTNIDGTTAFTMSNPYPSLPGTYRFTWTAGTAPVFRTDRVPNVVNNTAFTVTVNGPVATYSADPTSVSISQISAVSGVMVTPSIIMMTAVHSGVATVTTTLPHGLVVGQTVSIAGVTDLTYDGVFVVTSVPTTTTFTYVNTVSTLPSAGGTATYIPLTSIGTITVTTSTPHNLVVSENVVISGATDSLSGFSFNGTFTVLSIPTPTTFTYSMTTPSQTPILTTTVSASIATATTNSAHNLIAGETVSIVGVTDPTYNGIVVVISVPTPNTFTYANTVSLANSTGGNVTLIPSATAGTAVATNGFTTANVQVGDNMLILPGAGCSQASQGLFTILAKTSTSVTVQNLNAINESFAVLDATQFLIYSNGGTTNQTQINDTVDISAGFSLATSGNYTVTQVTPKWIEIAEAAPNGLPLESNIIPTAAGFVIYKTVKNFVMIAAQQSVAVSFNGDTSATVLIDPLEEANPERPGVLLKNGSFYKLTIQNNGLSTATVMVATAE